MAEPPDMVDGEAEEEDELHQSDNVLEQFTVDMRKKWGKVKKTFAELGGKKEEKKVMTVEQKKLHDISEIIKTYKEVDMDKDEDHIEPYWIDRPIFDVIMSFVIVCNTIAIGVELDMEHDGDNNRHTGWVWLEVMFMFIFVWEVRMKMKYHTWRWLCMDPWNIFTFGIAMMAIFNLILAIFNTGGQLRMLSLLRVIGMLRLLRVIRTYRSLKELRLIMQGMTGSLGMLCWTVLILVCVLYVSAVFTTSTIGRSEVYDNFGKTTNGWDADALFGSVGRSMYTLLQCMTRDAWSSDIARFVVAQQWYMAFFFIGFMLITTYGLLNLVVSVIVEQTLAAARNNESRVRAREERSKKSELDGLKELFLMADEDGSGKLDVNEFLHALEDEEVLWRMRQLELPIDDAARLFTVIDGEGTRMLSMEEFIDGCTKLKGPARSRDLLALTAQADTLDQKMDSLGEELQDSERMLHQLDEISVRITNRFSPAMKSSRKKIAKAVAGSAPVVPIHPEKLGSAIGVDLGTGNRPLLPKFPNLLK